MVNSIDINAAEFKYMGDEDTTCCEYCGLQISKWTSDMNPLMIHSQKKSDCVFIRSQKISLSLSTISEEQSPSGFVTNIIEQLGRCAFTQWYHCTRSFNILFVEVDFFNRHLSRDFVYVKGKLILSPTSSLFIVNGRPWRCAQVQENLPSIDVLGQAEFFYNGIKIIFIYIVCNGSLQNWRSNDNAMIEYVQWFQDCVCANELCTDEVFCKTQEDKRGLQERAGGNNLQLLILDESILCKLVAERSDLRIWLRLFNRKFKLTVIKQFWKEQIQLKEKQTNFKEERSATIEREQSFKNWPHSSPSRISMLVAGWSLDTTKGTDFTTCLHCDVERVHWKANDDPLSIHRKWSPFCPYILAKHPIHPSSIPIRTLNEMFSKEKINNAVTQPASYLISPSTSLYCLPPKREKSFRSFPGGPPRNTEKLVQSGFYYTGFGTTIKCYHCGGTVHDWHQYLSNQIDIQHRIQFPHCRFAQLLPRTDELRSTNRADLCKWCLVNPKEFAAYPCMHLAVCGPCTQLINSCSICSIETKAFFKLYM